MSNVTLWARPVALAAIVGLQRLVRVPAYSGAFGN
jgi:hypothetical protein